MKHRIFSRSFKRKSRLFLEGIKEGFIKDLIDGEREVESEANRSKGMEAGYYDGSVFPPQKMSYLMTSVTLKGS